MTPLSSPDEDFKDFRPFWQSKLFLGAMAVAALLGALLLALRLDLLSFATDQARDLIGEGRHLQKMIEEDLIGDTAMARFHRDAFPRYIAALRHSPAPQTDSNLSEHIKRLETLLDDQELRQLLHEIHQALLKNDTDALRSLAISWNTRQSELDQPFAIVLNPGLDHEDPAPIFETYHIHARLKLHVRERDTTTKNTHPDPDRERDTTTENTHPDPIRERDTTTENTHPDPVRERDKSVQWRRRLDTFNRAAEPTFVHPDTAETWVRSDRAWLTIWNVLTAALTADEQDEQAASPKNLATGWQQELRVEVEEILGEELFQALLRGSQHRAHLESIAREIARRGERCRHNYRIIRIPWLGFDTLAIDQMRAIARHDRLQNCPRVTSEEAAQIHRHSRDLQSDLSYQQAMPRLLAAFLSHKTFFAAAHQHYLSISRPPCPSCKNWTDEEAAEIGAYLQGTLQGPHPYLGIFKLCFDHRYGSSTALRGWLEILREAGLRCRQTLPENLLDNLNHIATERFTPIEPIKFVDPLPQTTPIYHRD